MQLRFLDASEDDFDTLVELRIEAMQESLKRLGRFNRERSIERFRASFAPSDTKKICVGDVLTGFYSLARETDHFHLNHLYVRPEHQCLGIGSLVMEEIIGLSKEVGLPIRLGALKGSRSNEFYKRHGFIVTTEDQWDTYYERRCEKTSAPNA